MNIIESKLAPEAIGPYSQAVAVDKTLYISGQLPVDGKTSQLVEQDIKKQTVAALDNMSYILSEAGLDFKHVVKTTVFLANMNDFVEMNKVYGEYFKSPFPARICVEVAKLPMGALVEIEAIAVSEVKF